MSGNSSSEPHAGRQNASPSPSVAVRLSNGAELTLGSREAGSSKTRILDWRAPILDAVGAGDSKSLRTMYHEAKSSSHPRTKVPTADDMILAAIKHGRFLIVGTIADLCPRYDWSDECFIEGLRCDMEARGNHYLLAYCRWSRNPLKKHGDYADALMWSILLGDVETAAMLLSWGADPNGCKWRGLYSHIHMAVSMYNTTRPRLPIMVNLLLRYGAVCSGQGLLTWVVMTVSDHPVEQEMVWTMTIMDQLIKAGTDINEIPPQYQDECPPNATETPLIAAALSGSRSLVCFILSHGANPKTIHKKSGRTAFECAYDALGKPEYVKGRDQLVSIFAEIGISPATLFGILESEHNRMHPKHCRCLVHASVPSVPDPEMRYLPVLKPEI